MSYGTCHPLVWDDLDFKDWYTSKEVRDWGIIKDINSWSRGVCSFNIGKAKFYSVEDIDVMMMQYYHVSYLEVSEMKLKLNLSSVTLRRWVPEWTIRNWDGVKTVSDTVLKRVIPRIRFRGVITLYSKVEAWLYFVEKMGIREMIESRKDPQIVEEIINKNMIKRRNYNYVW